VAPFAIDQALPQIFEDRDFNPTLASFCIEIGALGVATNILCDKPTNLLIFRPNSRFAIIAPAVARGGFRVRIKSA
jgi:hypothetical protein